MPAALIIGKRKESTDTKTSLNDALRDNGILRVLRIRDGVTVPTYINFSHVSSVELLDFAGKSWEEIKRG